MRLKFSKEMIEQIKQELAYGAAITNSASLIVFGEEIQIQFCIMNYKLFTKSPNAFHIKLSEYINLLKIEKKDLEVDEIEKKCFNHPDDDENCT